MLQIEPLAVQVLKAEELVRVEKFLPFFLPRQHRDHTIGRRHDSARHSLSP